MGKLTLHQVCFSAGTTGEGPATVKHTANS